MNAHRDVYQTITDRILAMLEAGTVPWRKPWTHAGPPRNYNGRPYRGINAFLLALAPFDVPVFLTFNRARELGGSVKRGEKGLPVVFWKIDRETTTDPETGDATDRALILARLYHVFNVAQTDGIDPAKLPDAGPTYPHEPIAEAAAIIAGMPNPPAIRHGGGRACYAPALDTVTLPNPERFEKAAEYYGTAFHELTHATGHASRLARKGIVDGAEGFGTEPYGQEELVAEMGAAFLCARCGLEPATLENSAAYIAGWIKTIEANPRAVVIAAAQAQKAADYIAPEAETEEAPQ